MDGCYIDIDMYWSNIDVSRAINICRYILYFTLLLVSINVNGVLVVVHAYHMVDVLIEY